MLMSAFFAPTDYVLCCIVLNRLLQLVANKKDLMIDKQRQPLPLSVHLIFQQLKTYNVKVI